MDDQSNEFIRSLIYKFGNMKFEKCTLCGTEETNLSTITCSSKTYENICSKCKNNIQEKRRCSIEKLRVRLYNRKNFNKILLETNIQLKHFDTKLINSITKSIFKSLHNNDIVYILGENSGTGKTTMSLQCMRLYLWKGKKPIYVRSVDLCDDLQTIYKGDKNITDLMQKYFNADILIIDDLGKEKCTEFVASRMYSIVDKRIFDGKKTIITSNLSATQIEKIYDSGFVSRLMSGKIIKVSGSDLRIK